MRIRCRLAVLCLLPTFVLPGCGGGAASTPEAAFEGFKGGMVAKDYSSAFSYLTAESQDLLVGVMMIGAGFSTFGSEENATKLNEILEKHGVDSKSSNEKSFEDVKDKGALFGDLLGFLESLSGADGEEPEPFTGKFETAELKDVKVDGDKATGTVGDEPMHFVKIDGRWLIDMKASMGPSGAGAPEIDMSDMPAPGDIEMPEITFEGENPFGGDNPAKEGAGPNGDAATDPESGSSKP